MKQTFDKFGNNKDIKIWLWFLTSDNNVELYLYLYKKLIRSKIVL